MEKKKKSKWKIIAVVVGILLVIAALIVLLQSCGLAGFSSKLGDIKGKLIGNSFDCYFYDNSGNKYLTVSGKKINMEGNVVEDAQINSKDGSVGTTYDLSAVITINVDGKQIQSCGDTVIFEEKGLDPDATFKLEDVDSSSSGGSGTTYISNIVNKYKNYFGKAQVVVIQSQLGVPICAYSGKKVYWEVSEGLPKTTKLMIDKKALYLHRANFQIIDRKLIQ